MSWRARVAFTGEPDRAVLFCEWPRRVGRELAGMARIKAETETDLAPVFGARLTVFRPGYVHPVHGRETPYWGDAIMGPFMPFRSAMSRWITDSGEVARAVLHAATGGSVPSPADNGAIIAASAEYRRARTSAASSGAASRTSARISR